MNRETYVEIGNRTGIDPAFINAVVRVESGNRSGFVSATDRRPLILFEPAVFNKRTNGKYLNSHPHLAIPKWSPSYKYGSYAKQWEKFEEAATLGEYVSAVKSCSWGLGQIMGFHYPALGYPDAVTWEASQWKVDGQVDAIARFINNDRRLKDAADRLDFHQFARIYNGPGYAKHGYHTRLENMYNEVKEHYA